MLHHNLVIKLTSTATYYKLRKTQRVHITAMKLDTTDWVFEVNQLKKCLCTGHRTVGETSGLKYSLPSISKDTYESGGPTGLSPLT